MCVTIKLYLVIAAKSIDATRLCISVRSFGAYIVVCIYVLRIPALDIGIKTNHEYILTDPCLLSHEVRHYGATDCGREYMLNWFVTHKCNKYCDKNWKKAKRNIIHETIAPTQASTLVWELATWAEDMLNNNVNTLQSMMSNPTEA